MGAPKQKWTSDEETALKAGVLKHGTGKWRTILSDPEFGSVLKSRSNVDLKDKWRNISVTALFGSRRKAKLAHKRTPSSGANQDADNTTALTIVALANGPTSPPPVPFEGPFTSEDKIIFEAITNSKKPCDKKSIWRYIEDNFMMEPNKKRPVALRLKYLTNVGVLIKTKHRYKISPNFMAAAENLTSQRPEENGVRDPSQSRVDGELNMINGMTEQEAAVAAARAVAEAEFAIAESEEAAREADEAEAQAEAAFIFAKSVIKALKYRMRSQNSEWRIGPKHLFVIFAIRILKQHATKAISGIRPKKEEAESERNDAGSSTAIVPALDDKKKNKMKFMWKAGIGNFVASGIVAYIDGRLCRQIPNPISRRIVSGFLLSFLDKSTEQ
ncbi:unnamed protein product [Thlaspi arvense]|uniref:MYB transcription factor n=1 Tax=Thlaspi arvense TaxID=13288 RepID=A0AAU9SEU8_THLAR|nr:unnamed protein product [Thlaspi arvense]